MACRKHSPGDPCCDAVACTHNRADLPVSFEFEGTTILRADWGQYYGEYTSGRADGCCWASGLSIVHPYEYHNRTFHCSLEYSLSATEASKIAAYRYPLGTNFAISKMTCVCDGLPSVNQYVVFITKFYVTKHNYFVYNPPSPSCEALAFRLDSVFPGGFATNYSISRSKYYAALPVGVYTLTSSDVSVCTPKCQGDIDFTNELVIAGLPGQTIVFNDTANWTFTIA